ncbi:MAG: glycerol-3-phosphate 1-O-acyltransferase PlsY [Boseongicola sp.]|nr:MAG: glycerol-3-phosphate 1-O-acyltransferase PlsY [Boseongicola sp.]
MPLIETSFSLLALTAVLSYILGSIPFGIVITRLLGLGDLRSIGSGNIGTTNVLRTGSKPAAAATLLLDSGKGAIAVLIARATLAEDAAQLAALSAFLGHLFPIWLDFKGGKGMATFLGTLLALAFPVGVGACLTWLAIAGLMRISSLSALVAALSTPIWAVLFGATSALAVVLIMVALIFQRHKDNIRRLLSGTEPRIGNSKPAPEETL